MKGRLQRRWRNKSTACLAVEERPFQGRVGAGRSGLQPPAFEVLRWLAFFRSHFAQCGA